MRRGEERRGWIKVEEMEPHVGGKDRRAEAVAMRVGRARHAEARHVPSFLPCLPK